MRKEIGAQKQNANDGDVMRDGFSAEELGAESGYDGTTEMEQQMRRGDETKGNPNDRDVVGASNAAIERDTHPALQRRNAKNNLQ